MNTKSIVLVSLILLMTTIIGCERQKDEKPLVKVRLQLKWRHQAQFAGFYIAEKRGFYSAENIDISLFPRTPSIPNEQMVTDLINGKTDFAIMGGDFLLKERAIGTPIVSIAIIFQRNPYVYAALKGSRIYRPQDLAGKKIMIPPDGKIQHVVLMEKLGIPLSDMSYLPYNRDADFLATGQIDAQMVYRTGSGLHLENNGLELDFIWLDDYGVRLYADTIVASERMIQENPDLIEHFLRASLKGWRYAIENPGEALSATLAYDDSLSSENQARMLQIQTPLIHTGENQIGWMEPAVWQNMQKILNIKVDQMDIRDAYTMDFLNRIYGGEKR